jgi:hypothetical protein
MKENLMKKFLYTLLALVLLSTPVFAADKAKIKVGGASGVAKEGVVAAQQGSFINISMAGIGKRGSAAVTVLVPADFSPEKGDTYELFSLIGQSASDNPGKLALGGFGTKVKGRTLFSYTEAENSVTNGKLKVKSYNPDTKELKFQVSAKVSPFTLVKSGLSGSKSKTSNKKMPIKVNAIVTLP